MKLLDLILVLKQNFKEQHNLQFVKPNFLKYNCKDIKNLIYLNNQTIKTKKTNSIRNLGIDCPTLQHFSSFRPFDTPVFFGPSEQSTSGRKRS